MFGSNLRAYFCPPGRVVDPMQFLVTTITHVLHRLVVRLGVA